MEIFLQYILPLAILAMVVGVTALRVYLRRHFPAWLRRQR